MGELGRRSARCVFSRAARVVRLFQVKMEREQYQTEIRDLQDQLSEMHDELDSAKKSVSDEEKDGIMAVKHLHHYNGEKKKICYESFDFQQ